MRSKDKALQGAMKRLQVRIHPRIYEIATLISQAEIVDISPGVPDLEPDDIPDVEPYLDHLAYREVLPARFVKYLTRS